MGSGVCASSPQIHHRFTLQCKTDRCPDLSPLLEVAYEFLTYTFKFWITEPCDLSGVDTHRDLGKTRHALVLLCSFANTPLRATFLLQLNVVSLIYVSHIH